MREGKATPLIQQQYPLWIMRELSVWWLENYYLGKKEI